MVLADRRGTEGKDERNGTFRVALFATLPLLSFPILAPLGSVDVIGVHLFVLLFLFLGQLLPVDTFFGRESLPLLADRFGQISLALLLRWPIECCFLLGCLTFFAAFPSEEDKGVLGTLDIIFIAFLRSAVDFAAYRRLAAFVRRWW